MSKSRFWLKFGVAGAASMPVVGVLYSWGPSPFAMKRIPHSDYPPSHGSYDICVIGGGICGLAIAKSVQHKFPGQTVCVLEKEPAVASHQSSHNSGVVHAGFAYPPGSSKAKMCVRGAELMYDYCTKRNIPCEKNGKIIVASHDDELPQLETFLSWGVANGVAGLELLRGQSAIHAIEPNVAGVAALVSPNSGIADFAAVARSLAREFVAGVAAPGVVKDKKIANGTIYCNFSVEKIEGNAEKVRIAGREPGQAGPLKSVDARVLITAAGVHADQVSKAAGGERHPKATTFRGSYYVVKPHKKDIVQRSIYPVPPPNSGIPVGIHVNPTVSEQRGRHIIVGPSAALCFAKEGYSGTAFSFAELSEQITNFGFISFLQQNLKFALTQVLQDVNQGLFMAEAQKLIPSLQVDDVEPGFSGVMPQVFGGDGTPLNDFLFEIASPPCPSGRDLVNESSNLTRSSGIPARVLNCRNLPSPAATSSLAIGEHVAELVEKEFGKLLREV